MSEGLSLGCRSPHSKRTGLSRVNSSPCSYCGLSEPKAVLRWMYFLPLSPSFSPYVKPSKLNDSVSRLLLLNESQLGYRLKPDSLQWQINNSFCWSFTACFGGGNNYCLSSFLLNWEASFLASAWARWYYCKAFCNKWLDIILFWTLGSLWPPVGEMLSVSSMHMQMGKKAVTKHKD